MGLINISLYMLRDKKSFLKLNIQQNAYNPETIHEYTAIYTIQMSHINSIRQNMTINV